MEALGPRLCCLGLDCCSIRTVIKGQGGWGGASVLRAEIGHETATHSEELDRDVQAKGFLVEGHHLGYWWVYRGLLGRGLG